MIARGALELLLAASIVLAGCSAPVADGRPGQQAPTPAGGYPVGPATASVRGTVSQSAPSAAMTASDVVAKFKAAGLPIGQIVVYTAATDPNHLLGRPGQYTSDVHWVDTSLDASQAMGSTPGDIELGGGVETFPDASAAQTRLAYISAVIKNIPRLAEDDHVIGTSVLRLSHLLTPGQAAKYKAAAS